jgi:hypothetical protein
MFKKCNGCGFVWVMLDGDPLTKLVRFECSEVDTGNVYDVK